MLKQFSSILLLSFLALESTSQQAENAENLVIYKTIDTNSMKMEVFYPPAVDMKRNYPCVVFFYGGGWIGRNFNQFRPHANQLVKKGLVCFLVDYRTQSKQDATPFESLMDAKSAIRFIRQNAERFHINKDLLIAAGGSAGGHLAAATALIDGYDDASDNRSVSPRPNALVLFNPVIDNGPGGYGFERIGNQYKDFSPLHNIQKGAPPTIIFLGTKDELIPVETMQYYKTAMEKVGSKCELFLYDGEGHGFFNKKEFITKTLDETVKFLTLTAFLK